MPFGDLDAAHRLRASPGRRGPAAGHDRDAFRTALDERADPDERPLPADPPLHGVRELGPSGRCSRTDAVADRVLTLPLYAHMSDEQIELVYRRERSGARVG